MPKKNKVYICTLHDEIIDAAEELQMFDFAEGQKLKAKKLLAKIIASAEEARDDGQDMENRLDEYYSAIVSLGFTRNKK